MFTWFRRDAEFLGYEARELSAGKYELVIRQPDGTERVEHFSDQNALTERQMELQRELEGEGWTGPHGWNL
jgi:hypothetical protein